MNELTENEKEQIFIAKLQMYNARKDDQIRGLLLERELAKIGFGLI
ncbi:hypothetical protein MWU78_14385 [Arenibacter sp. F26102]|nr:hypothetical protein [Arenibacter sp. F26102]MCK0146842.1 hypothetical protein [Arenibacter sp. F26102]